MLQTFDSRNKEIQVFIKDRLYAREEAKISVFDSSVQGGDAVWEGLRLYEEGIFLLDRHLNRLKDSAKAMHFQDVPSIQFVKDAIKKTLIANDMKKDVHIRLTLTRGEKITSGMDPRLNQMGCTLIVLAEWKPPVYDNNKGIRLISSSIRRNNPSFVDSKIHHNNLINNILAKIQANIAGADAALMLDKDGFAAELNGTNFFLIKNNIIYTPFANACLHGITRGFVMELAQKEKLLIKEKDISLAEIYTADHCFCTGTMGELTPIYSIDGREISTSHSIFDQLNRRFHECLPSYCISL